jgi:hypothetical protein
MIWFMNDQLESFRKKAALAHICLEGKSKVKLSSYLIKHYAMKAYGGVDV